MTSEFLTCLFDFRHAIKVQPQPGEQVGFDIAAAIGQPQFALGYTTWLEAEPPAPPPTLRPGGTEGSPAEAFGLSIPPPPALVGITKQPAAQLQAVEAAEPMMEQLGQVPGPTDGGDGREATRPPPGQS